MHPGMDLSEADADGMTERLKRGQVSHEVEATKAASGLAARDVPERPNYWI